MSQEVHLGGFLGCLDKAKRLIDVIASGIDSMKRPDNESPIFHLLGGRDSDLVGATNHPRKNGHSFWEDDNALGLHSP